MEYINLTDELQGKDDPILTYLVEEAFKDGDYQTKEQTLDNFTVNSFFDDATRFKIGDTIALYKNGIMRELDPLCASKNHLVLVREVSK